MKYKNILITGGCGFIGSTIALSLAGNKNTHVIALDSLYRKGSEFNVDRLRKAGVRVIKGDIRNPSDLAKAGPVDLLIECSAEPSVMAGLDDPTYLIDTNLKGTLNCLELARRNKADFLFLSTSRIYPLASLMSIKLEESPTRFEISEKQSLPGITKLGISEEFPVAGARTLYGATKFASEIMVQEYLAVFGMKGMISRFGVIAGPWQFGKSDQGIVSLWVLNHFFKKPLSYIGFGGTGKQVRDILHVDDLVRAILIQIENLEKYSGQVVNIGGGREVSTSLAELTVLCEDISGNKVVKGGDKQNRPGDVPLYITDYSKWNALSAWKPTKSVKDIVKDTYDWVKAHADILNNL